MPPDDRSILNRMQMLEGQLATMQAQIQDLESSAPSSGVEEFFPNVPNVCIGSVKHDTSIGGSGTPSTSNGTLDLQSVLIELDDSVIDVDLANDEIVVKEGVQGIVLLNLQCEAELYIYPAGTHVTAAARVTKTAAAVDCRFQASLGLAGVAISGGNPYIFDYGSATYLDYVDASGGDISYGVDYTMGTDSGLYLLRLKEFSVTLFTDTDSATPGA